MIWAEQELNGCKIGDERRPKRAIAIAGARANRPNASLPESLGCTSEVKAGYRFFENEAIDAKEIVAAHSREAIERAKASGNKQVVAIQDTMHVEGRGIERWVHSALLASVDGVPYGIVGVQLWERRTDVEKEKVDRKKKPTSEKESQKWLEGIRSAAKLQVELSDGQEVICVADRESDVFDALTEGEQQGIKMLIRAAQDRRIAEDQTRKLWDYVTSQPIAGEMTVQIQRKGGRQERNASCVIRWIQVTLQPPKARPARDGLNPLQVTVIYVCEKGTPGEGNTPIEWMLLTTLTVADLEGATHCVRLYAVRWLIEMYHKTLKSGCAIEDRQLETFANFKRYLAIDLIVAWRLLYLTMRARVDPHAPCTEVLEACEWHTLYLLTFQKKHSDDTIPTLSDVILCIAKLGRYLARRSDGPPGIIVTWRGMIRLHDSVIAISLLQSCG